MKGPQILNLPPPPSLPSPIPIPPKAPRQTQSSRAPFYPFFPRAHYIKRHKMNVLVLSFAVSDTSSYPPPHPDAFPLATSKRQHASYNNNSLSQQTRKTKNSHTNQPASQRQAKVSSEQRMHAKTTTITAAARQKAKRGPPADRLHPQIKKKQEQQVGAAYAHPSPPPRTSLAPQKIFFSAPRPHFPPETTS